MARTAIPVTTVTHDGVVRPAQTSSDAANDHEFANDGRTVLEIENTDAGSVTVTVQTVQTVGSPAIPVEDKSIVLTTGQVQLVGPFSKRIFNQAGDLVYVDVTVATNIKFRAYSVP